MLSRVAEAIYWMSRYAERAENVARFVEVNFYLTLDLPEGAQNQWLPLVSVTGDEEQFRERYGKGDRDSVLEFLLFDPEYPNSAYSCLRFARENARTVREMISTDMWDHPIVVAQIPHEYVEQLSPVRITSSQPNERRTG